MSYHPDALPRTRRKPTDPARASALCAPCGVRFTPGRGRPMPLTCPTCGHHYWFSDTELIAITRHNEELR
jgi:hypothetical protein